MDSLEQQMALFEELISQEQPPSNGIGGGIALVATTRPRILPAAFSRPGPPVAIQARIMAPRPHMPMQPRPPVGLMQQGPRGSPMDQSTFIHASRIAKDVAPGPSKDDAKPPPKRVKPNDHKKPDPPQEQSEELKQAIAKAMAAANATNTKKYNQPMKNNGFQNRPMGNQPPHNYPPPPPRRPTPVPPPPMMQPPVHNAIRPPVRPPGPPVDAALYYGALTHKIPPEMLGKKKKEKKDKKTIRTAAGDIWEDSSLLEWDDNDFRIFVGDLGNECNDEMLYRAFSKYPSAQKVRVVRDKRSNKTKGYGFVSFSDANDYIKAMREVNGKYIGNRPCKLRKSTWKDRQLSVVRKKNTEKQKLGLKV